MLRSGGLLRGELMSGLVCRVMETTIVLARRPINAAVVGSGELV